MKEEFLMDREVINGINELRKILDKHYTNDDKFISELEMILEKNLCKNRASIICTLIKKGDKKLTF